MNYKRLIILLMIISSFLVFNVRAEETIIDSEYVTYDNEKTLKKNVRGALDELIDRVGEINTGGDASATDIKKGKTAYVNGTLITGDHEDKPVYFKGANDYRVSLNGVDVYCYTTDSSIGLIYGSQEITLRTVGANDSSPFCSVVQVSPYVVLVNYGWTTTSGVIDTNTDTKYQSSYTDTYYNYLAGYYLSGTTLTRKGNPIAGGIGNNDTTNYPAYASDYYNSYSTWNSNWELTSSYGTSRNTRSSITQSLYQDYVHNMMYFDITGNAEENYYNDFDETKNYHMWYYWWKTIGINTYTGALSDGTITYGTAKQMDSTSLWTAKTNYKFSNYGIILSNYTTTAQDVFSSNTYYDYYGVTRINTVTSNGSDNADSARSLDYILYGSLKYPFSTYGTINPKSIKYSISSSILGSDTVAAPYFVANPPYYTRTQTFDFSSILPSDVTITSLVESNYSISKGKIYFKYKCNKGYLFLIFGMDESTAYKREALQMILESASYREELDGALIGSERLYTDTNAIRVIEFMK